MPERKDSRTGNSNKPGQTELRLGELRALISMVDEPNEKNYRLIREKIIAYGGEAVAELEDILDREFGELVQDRVVHIIQEIQYDQVYAELKEWVAEGSSDLLKGFLIVSQYQYPNLDDVDVRTRIDQLTRDVWLEINEDLTALEKVKVINHVLYDVHQYGANRAEMHAPQNFFVNTLLETKKGSPLSLGILYILIARKLDLPIYGVNLPQHFILAYTQEDALFSESLPPAEEVLFYLNPFNRGAVFTRNEIELFIKQVKIKAEPSFFSPCSNKVIIRRLLTNLVFSYENLKKKDKAGDIGRLLGLLD